MMHTFYLFLKLPKLLNDLFSRSFLLNSTEDRFAVRICVVIYLKALKKEKFSKVNVSIESYSPPPFNLFWKAIIDVTDMIIIRWLIILKRIQLEHS